MWTVKERAYTGAVHAVVDSAELSQRDAHHFVDTSFVGNINFYCCCLEIGMRGEIPALFGCSLGTFFIDVCENYTFASGLSESNRCLLANAAGSLNE